MPESGRRPTKPRAERPTSRGVQGLVGAGPSQVGISGAMRARDVSRPSATEVADAERNVVLRRQSPPATAPATAPAPVPHPPAQGSAGSSRDRS